MRVCTTPACNKLTFLPTGFGNVLLLVQAVGGFSIRVYMLLGHERMFKILPPPVECDCLKVPFMTFW